MKFLATITFKIFACLMFFVLIQCNAHVPWNNDLDKHKQNNDSTAHKNTDTNSDPLVENDNIQLKRTYWKLYRHSDNKDSCYFLPRPDNTPYARAKCDANTKIGQQMKIYHLCKEKVDPQVINHIPCPIALEISTVLNDQLRFDKDFPYPSDDDRVAACKIEPCKSDNSLAEYCEYYRKRHEAIKAGQAIPAIMRVDSEKERAAMAVCLNKVYGVEK